MAKKLTPAAVRAKRKVKTPKADLIEIAYNKGVEHGIKACGGCKSCYGKGYSTVMNDPHLGEGERIFTCKCPRGLTLKLLGLHGSLMTVIPGTRHP